MIKLALLGATGRMGTRIIDCLTGDDRFQTVALLTGSDDPRLGQSISVQGETLTVSDTCDTPFDALIDFSVPSGTMTWLDHCRSNSSAIIIGATGHTPAQLETIESAATDIPILKASNFSVGVNLLIELVAQVAQQLGPDYDIEIVEHHHNQKIDATSGTAVSLLDAVCNATDRSPDTQAVHGRQGQAGKRPKGQIGVHAVRMGTVVGHHEVHFGGTGETITLQHTAISRDTFAKGAIEAAAWLTGKPSGRYAMTDVLASRLGNA